MRIERLTKALQEALADAQSLAIGRDHAAIEPVHLLVALLGQSGGVARPLLAQAGFDLAGLEGELEAQLQRLPVIKNPTGEANLSSETMRLLNLADKLAQQQDDQFIAVETLLLAAFDHSQLAAILNRFGNRDQLKSACERVRGGETVQSADAEGQRQALEKYTIDLTERARSGKLDPVIGRDDEIRRTIQVLQRRTKNNPVQDPRSSRAWPSASSTGRCPRA